MITFEQLKEEFSDTVIHALKLLTHDDSVEYMDYIRAINDNPIAKNVKLADLKHNSDMTRLDEWTEKDARRNLKYAEAIKILRE